jgi:hypothetical protein
MRLAAFMARGVGSSVYLIARNFPSSCSSHNIVLDYRSVVAADLYGKIRR